MQPAHAPSRFVPDARMTIPDPMLSTLRDQAYGLGRGETVSDAEAHLLLAAIGPLLDELIQRRTAMAAIQTITAPGNVIVFERGQG